MSKTAKIIVGANYGDEGKGLATAYFAHIAQQSGQKALNILYNGGPQRGHTVESDDYRHVFHHFGAGTACGIHTYFDKDFMVNPMFFVGEYCDLCEHPDNPLRPVSFVHPDCRVTTPYDMFINQIVEIHRAGSKHGSCGFGIWETQKRYENHHSLTYSQLISLPDDKIRSYLDDIRTHYLPHRLNLYGITYADIPQEYRELLSDEMSEGLNTHYIQDLHSMASVCPCKRFSELVDEYTTFLYEGGQGLALDAENAPMKPWVTASRTGSGIPVQRVSEYVGEVEVVYVTRTYLTRHGAGPFPTECHREEIPHAEVDKTNSTNKWQDSFRYGKFDWEEVWERVRKDIENSKAYNSDIKTGLMVTHAMRDAESIVERWEGSVWVSEGRDYRPTKRIRTK